jgi:hypothetical protein
MRLCVVPVRDAGTLDVGDGVVDATRRSVAALARLPARLTRRDRTHTTHAYLCALATSRNVKNRLTGRANTSYIA